MVGPYIVSAIALLLAIASIAISYWQSPPEVLRRLTALEADHLAHAESVVRWMKRENVRRAREVKEDGPVSQTPPPAVLDINQRKVDLRRRVAAARSA